MRLTSIATVAAVGIYLSPQLKADLVADYQFLNNFNSSVGTAPPLTPIAQSGTTGSFSTETVDGFPNVTVFTFSGNRGLTANTAAILPTSNDDYSVVFYTRLTIDEPSGIPPLAPIVKILDFKNRMSDSGQYVVAGVPTFYDGLLPVVPGAGLMMDDVYAQFVLTRDGATDLVSVYLDGSPLFSFTDTSGLTVLDENVLTLFADDPNSAGVPTGLQIEAAAGAIARLRIYDDALSPSAVASLDTIAVPESSFCMFVAATAALAGAAIKRAQMPAAATFPQTRSAG